MASLTRTLRSTTARLVGNARQAATRGSRLKELEQALQQGLPAELDAPIRFLITGSLPTPDDVAVANKVETIRSALSKQQGDASVYYSPKPGSAGEDASPDARPERGKEMRFDLHKLAYQTSVDPEWGQFLYLVAKSSKARKAIELGSCAGISGAYIASAPDLEQFLTIEGSGELADYARRSIGQVGDNATVIHGLFDEALDTLLPDLSGLDLAWIDGHHERVATIHYFQRLTPALNPGAIVLFDDISWSQDMRDGWNVLAGWPGFSHTVDLGKCGIGVWEGGEAIPRKWDLRHAIGQSTQVGTPHGWNDEN